MSVIDLHCDALSLADENGVLRGQVTVEKMKRGGALAQCFAVFVPPDQEQSAYGNYLAAVSRFYKLLEREKKELSLALSPEDVLNNEKNGKISAVLTVEGAAFLEGRERGLEEAYALGVRMLSLTWNHPNFLGFPCSLEEREDALGLTRAGEETVEKMQELGILLDVSHLSRGGFERVARLCRKPFLASHSCCYALCPHPRNLRDDQLRLLGETGGVVGLNYYSRFLRPGASQSQIADLLTHARHIVNVAGIEALALGSDFDGIDTPVSFGDWAGMEEWTRALSREFSPREAEKICRENFLRLWKEAGRASIPH